MLNDNFTTDNNTRSLNSCIFFQGLFPGLLPTASSGSAQVFFAEFIWIDVFSRSPIYVNQHPFWRIFQSTMVAFVAKYYALMW